VSDDVQLIDLTLGGDSSAFGRLVGKYQDRLYAAMVHVTASRTDAEDVVQDAFVRAYVKLDTFQRTSGFYTWLYRIAFNLAISRKRRHKPHASVEQSREIAGNEPISPVESVSTELERAEEAKQVREAMSKLSEEHRAILVLREMEGCDYESIAEILDLPVGTVRSRIHRARAQLKTILEVDLQDER
jgi:RNA polymerase sigma-70 factor (ECF subfamily)